MLVLLATTQVTPDQAHLEGLAGLLLVLFALGLLAGLVFWGRS